MKNQQHFIEEKQELFPTEIRELLVKIPDEELKKIGVNANACRPEWAILTSLLVPPVTVRPSIILESGERSEDDLTHKLSDIIRANQRFGKILMLVLLKLLLKIYGIYYNFILQLSLIILLQEFLLQDIEVDNH